ncbi:MAG: short-chain alcohol dehydrogenase [Acidimicrobiales bacterium]|nr:short-chain alcohol dehydrogenase [Acidimicrobiales bacterium]
MTTSTLAGRRVLVIGASSGIGRSFAVRAVKAGADVLMAARRQARLDEAVAEAGGGRTVVADVAMPDDCRRVADEAARQLGSVDLVLSSVGTAPLRRIEETTAGDWMSTFQTNVVGFNTVLAGLVPTLADGALVLALSSEAVHMPRWALAAYGASKAALEQSVRCWRIEHPRIRFGTVGVGSTVPTEFGDGFDGPLLTTALGVWTTHGQSQAEFMDTDDVAEVLLGVVASVLPFPGIGMEHIILRTPTPVIGPAG